MTKKTGTPKRTKVFLSYDKEFDEEYGLLFEQMFGDKLAFIQPKEDQEYYYDLKSKVADVALGYRALNSRNAELLIVLIGEFSWHKKNVDWDVAASIATSKTYSKSAILGIILPSYPSFHQNQYNHYTLPPRFADNLDINYVELQYWTKSWAKISKWITKALRNRDQISPVSRRSLYPNDRKGQRWQK